MAPEVPIPGGAVPELATTLAARAEPRDLKAAADACLADPRVGFFLEAVGGLALILDPHRQVLAVSPGVMALLGPEAPSPLGRRPGELFGCIHAEEVSGGCGAGRACTYCGALLTVLACQARGDAVEGECQLSLRRGGHLEAAEFGLRASHLGVAGRDLIAVVLRDLGPAKRKEVLERLFFHDVANLVQGIRGWAELLAEGEASPRTAGAKLLRLTERLGLELRSHQDLARAESGHLKPERQPVRPGAVLAEVRDLVARHPASRHRELRLEAPSGELIWTDPGLLVRVLLNMAVNALEATPEGAVITMAARPLGAGLRLEVRNPGEIPPAVGLRIFHRSFTTKGEPGRGLGTYAMKLFGEGALGGQVGFTTGGGETVFHIDLPRGD